MSAATILARLIYGKAAIKAFAESEHPRQPSGSAQGGEFAPKADEGSVHEGAGIENAAAEAYDYDSWQSAGNKDARLQEVVARISESFGMKPKIVVLDDGEFDRRPRGKISAEGLALGGKAAFSYNSREHAVYIRRSRLNAASKDANAHRLFMNGVIHELGHAHHAEKLGIRRVGVGEYASTFPERYAGVFSSALAWAHKMNRARKNPRDRLHGQAKGFNAKKHWQNLLRDEGLMKR